MEDGFVYFIRAGTSARVKIGWALNPVKRMTELQTGCPDVLHLIGTVAGAPALERLFHRTFAEHRIQGEWFTIDYTVGLSPLPVALAPPQEPRSEVQIHRYVMRKGGTVTAREIQRNLDMKMRDLSDALAALQESGLVALRRGPKGRVTVHGIGAIQ